MRGGWQRIGFPLKSELESFKSKFAQSMLVEGVQQDPSAVPVERRVPRGGTVRDDRTIVDAAGKECVDEEGNPLVMQEGAVLEHARWRETYGPEVASDDAIDLLCQLMRYDPSERITPANGIHHPYCEQFHDAETEYVWEGPVITNPMDDNDKKTTKMYREQLYERTDAKAAQRAGGASIFSRR